MPSRCPTPEVLEAPAASPTPDPDELLTRRETAGLCRVSERTLELLATEGGGPPFLRIGRLVRYRRSALRAWLAARERRSTPEAQASDLDQAAAAGGTA